MVNVENGALQTGYIAMIDSMRTTILAGRQLTIGKVVAIPKIAFDGVNGYSVSEHTIDRNKACLFGLRIPYANVQSPQNIMYKVLLICSHGNLTDNYDRFFPSGWGLSGLSPYLLYNPYDNMDTQGISNVGGVSYYGLSGSAQSRAQGSIFKNIINDVNYTTTDDVKYRLKALVNSMYSNDCGSPMFSMSRPASPLKPPLSPGVLTAQLSCLPAS